MAITGIVDLGISACAATVDHDPKSVATDLPKGSLIITADGLWYRKKDDGATTNVGNLSFPMDFRRGFLSASTAVSTLDVGIGVGRDKDDKMDLILTSAASVDITTSGAGGLDTGSESANTWYAIHVIGDSTGTNGEDAMISLSATVPTMPSGYDSFRHVGWVRNDGSSNFRLFEYYTEFYCHYKEPRTSITVLSSGSATTWTTVDASAFVPSSSKVMIYSPEFDTTSTANTFQIRPNGSTLTDPVINIRPAELSGSTYIYPLSILQLDNTQKLEYQVTQSTDNVWIYCDGFYDFIN